MAAFKQNQGRTIYNACKTGRPPACKHEQVMGGADGSDLAECICEGPVFANGSSQD
jgi:hypothetical protein